MKTLKLVVDLSGIIMPKENKRTSQELVTSIIKNVILLWANSKRGMNEEERRKYYKIADAFDLAVKEKSESVKLEDDWFGIIKTAFKDALLTPDPILRKVEELISEVKNR